MGVQRGVFAAGVVAAAVLSAVPAHAEQFLLFDVQFTYTWQDAVNASPSQSHYYVNDDNVLNTERPEDWLSPVDFRNGTVHIRLEVIDKPPGDQTANWTLCYIANEGGYGCAQTGVYTSEGVFESDVDMTSWWNNDVIDWSQGIKQMDLIYKKSTAGLDHIHFFPELEPLLTPTTVRITMVQVAAGDTYDESLLDLDFAGGEGTAGSGGSGGGENQGGTGGRGGSTSLPAGAGGIGGTSNAGSTSAGEGGAAVASAGGSSGASSEPIAGTAGIPASPPVAAAGAPISDGIPQAGTTSAPQSQGPAASDQTTSCAVNRSHSSGFALSASLLLLMGAVVRRGRRAPLGLDSA